jgi:hypothetical protein
MEIREALEQLEQQGHTVQYRPILDRDRLLYQVDGNPLTEDQVLKWINDGVRPNSSASASGMTIQAALSKLAALGHVVEPRSDPVMREGIQYFRIDGQFRSERQILDYLITGKSLLTPIELEQGHSENK